jgi:hypothetical protein
MLKAGAVGVAVLAALVEACDSDSGGGGYGYLGYGHPGYGYPGYGYPGYGYPGYGYPGYGLLGPARERIRRALNRGDIARGPGRQVG